MLYFCMPATLWFSTFIIILVTYGVRALTQVWLPSFISSDIAAGVSLTAAIFANSGRGSGPLSLALFLPSFWLIVPGSMSFVAIAGVLSKNASLGDLGHQALSTLLSMAIGIMIATLVYPARAPKATPAPSA